MILGVIRGKGADDRANPDATGSASRPRPDPFPATGVGRPHATTRDDLVMWLAIDWHHVTGQVVRPGRRDQTAFGALVHAVFAWLSLETADQSLRRYRETVGDAEAIEIEGGRILR